ncbi:hypothetical protein CO038_01170 [Candidatus Pacearchaeota archaeon CG_4_9_14_0_2_um_filter_39_13]|nr:adenylyltransferase/cytidyltransferase family protein [Candidatus Pacearchaeota archaeon]OIO43207.1 MAG: hypothetical protein AUJ64_02590 [Candidatus Pacearchaeota archaeon CG1_02_39_14]PJC44904.1 MAG: hypothetical protein CO038_01170 [Candidatus Pacearchaeota archaeon CG_4_9_14_0_2_um_filter_39_13]
MIINSEELRKIREQNKDRKIVFCSGNFDLTHAGHILFFEDCKRLGDLLVVGIGGDSIMFENKKRVILNEHIRLKTIDSLKPVDLVLLDKISNIGNRLKFIDFVLEELKPDFYVVNEDAFDMPYRKTLCERLNINLKILPRTCPPEFGKISTSELIRKIKEL